MRLSSHAGPRAERGRVGAGVWGGERAADRDVRSVLRTHPQRTSCFVDMALYGLRSLGVEAPHLSPFCKFRFCKASPVHRPPRSAARCPHPHLGAPPRPAANVRGSRAPAPGTISCIDHAVHTIRLYVETAPRTSQPYRAAVAPRAACVTCECEITNFRFRIPNKIARATRRDAA